MSPPNQPKTSLKNLLPASFAAITIAAFVNVAAHYSVISLSAGTLMTVRWIALAVTTVYAIKNR